MALKMAMNQKGFDFAEAHIEIVVINLNRDQGLMIIGYRVYANRAAAVAAPQQNVLHEGTHTMTFADIGAPLGTFYTAIQAKLLEQFPAAILAADAF